MSQVSGLTQDNIERRPDPIGGAGPGRRAGRARRCGSGGCRRPGGGQSGESGGAGDPSGLLALLLALMQSQQGRGAQPNPLSQGLGQLGGQARNFISGV